MFYISKFCEDKKMDLFSIIMSAVTIFAGSFFVLIGGSYIAYKIRKKSM